MNKFVIACSAYDEFCIEVESKEKIRELLNPVLEELMGKIKTEIPPSYTWGYHEWIKMQVSSCQFEILGYGLSMLDFICYNYDTRKLYTDYEIFTLDEWFDHRKMTWSVNGSKNE